jgi:hypothetical protein
MCFFSDLATTLQTLLTIETERAASGNECVRRKRKLFCCHEFIECSSRYRPRLLREGRKNDVD